MKCEYCGWEVAYGQAPKHELGCPNEVGLDPSFKRMREIHFKMGTDDGFDLKEPKYPKESRAYHMGFAHGVCWRETRENEGPDPHFAK